jgi:hypothetical protein
MQSFIHVNINCVVLKICINQSLSSKLFRCLPYDLKTSARCFTFCSQCLIFCTFLPFTQQDNFRKTKSALDYSLDSPPFPLFTNRENIHKMIESFEDVRQAMGYLRLIIQNLERAEESATTTNPTPLGDEEDTASEATMPPVFDTAPTTISSATASTTNSDVLLDVLIEDSAPFGPFTIDDLVEALLFIARRVTRERFIEVTTKPLAQFAEAFQDSYQKLNLSHCEVSENMHQFEEVRRCHRCDIQLCKVSFKVSKTCSTIYILRLESLIVILSAVKH